jgi:hypothetical protein
MSQPDIIALLGNNYSLQLIETGFVEQFYASHRIGPPTICLKISARIAERKAYRMIPLKTRLFSHWSIPLRSQGKNQSGAMTCQVNIVDQGVLIQVAVNISIS